MLSILRAPQISWSQHENYSEVTHGLGNVRVRKSMHDQRLADLEKRIIHYFSWHVPVEVAGNTRDLLVEDHGS